jgi:4-hydroxy-3-methylbut-2-enyl diphosphate reductase
MTLVDEREGVNLPGWNEDTPVVVLTQTTLSVDDTNDVVKDVQRTFPNAITRADICYATTNRQESVKALAEKVDIVLVIGAQNSSNCNRLREVAEAQGVPAYLINGPEDMDQEWLEGVSRVGITSGASTPEVLVDEVIKALKPNDVTTLSGIEENVSFVLPRELR